MKSLIVLVLALGSFAFTEQMMSLEELANFNVNAMDCSNSNQFSFVEKQMRQWGDLLQHKKAITHDIKILTEMEKMLSTKHHSFLEAQIKVSGKALLKKLHKLELPLTKSKIGLTQVKSLKEQCHALDSENHDDSAAAQKELCKLLRQYINSLNNCRQQCNHAPITVIKIKGQIKEMEIIQGGCRSNGSETGINIGSHDDDDENHEVTIHHHHGGAKGEAAKSDAAESSAKHTKAAAQHSDSDAAKGKAAKSGAAKSSAKHTKASGSFETEEGEWTEETETTEETEEAADGTEEEVGGTGGIGEEMTEEIGEEETTEETTEETGDGVTEETTEETTEEKTEETTTTEETTDGADGTTDGTDGTTDGADGTTDGTTDGATGGATDGATDGATGGATDGATGGATDGATGGATDGATGGAEGGATGGADE